MFKSLEDKIVYMPCLLKYKISKNVKSKEEAVAVAETKMVVLERESLTFLYKYARSDRRRSSGQKGELLYAERALRGYQILGVSSNSER